MSVKFNQLVAKMPELLKRLGSQPFLTKDNLADIPEKGVYVFYENDEALYVGRSNRLKARIQQHGRPSSTHNSATFAFNIAKEEIARHQDIPRDITRKALEKAPGFVRLFYQAKGRVAQMKIRFIEIEDQIEQAMFEIYVHLALNTRYNDFRTH